MKNFWLPVIVASLLVSGQFAAAQSANAPRRGKAAATSTKKKAVKKAVRKPPPVDPTEGDNVDGDDLTVRAPRSVHWELPTEASWWWIPTAAGF